MKKIIKKVPAAELSKFRMAAGNEKKYRMVIDEGTLKEWVGIGWVDIREATETDHQKFPIVTRPDPAAYSIESQ